MVLFFEISSKANIRAICLFSFYYYCNKSTKVSQRQIKNYFKNII